MPTRAQIWKKLLKRIIEKGHKHTKDDSPIREIIGVHEFIPNLFVDAGLFHQLNRHEMLDWVEKGFADIEGYPMKGEALAKYAGSLDDPYMIDGGDFVYTYPERLCNYITVDLFGEIIERCDQLDLMVHRLMNNSGSNRSVAVLYNPGRDGVEEDIPCLNWVQALIREDEYTGSEKLILSVMFRSNDCYGAWPGNMLFLNYLGLKIVDELKDEHVSLSFEGIDYHCSSLHIYETDLPAALDVVKE